MQVSCSLFFAEAESAGKWLTMGEQLNALSQSRDPSLVERTHVNGEPFETLSNWNWDDLKEGAFEVQRIMLSVDDVHACMPLE